VAPAKVEQFLALNWPVMSTLLTDHGPWEGFNVAKQEVIQVQTSAHTLSLILGLLGTSSEYMKRYLDYKGLSVRLDEIYKPGEKVDLLGGDTQVFAWGDKQSTLTSNREKDGFHVKSNQVKQVGVAFVSSHVQGVSLSGGLLSLRYRSSHAIDRATIGFKPAAGSTVDKLIPKEVFTRFADTKGLDAEIQVPLPATPGLTGIKEVVITFGQPDQSHPVDLAVTQFTVTPYSEPYQVSSIAK